MSTIDVWTVGHSTHSGDAFAALLAAHEIEQVADVRTVPKSRRHPHFHTDVLARDLHARGVAYEHLPRLGGWRPARPDSPNGAWRNTSFRGYADYAMSEEFAMGLAQLRELAATRRTAMMCSEALWWRCHRRLIADRLVAAGDTVCHISSNARTAVHQLTSFAVVGPGRQIMYPGPAIGRGYTRGAAHRPVDAGTYPWVVRPYPCRWMGHLMPASPSGATPASSSWDRPRLGGLAPRSAVGSCASSLPRPAIPSSSCPHHRVVDPSTARSLSRPARPKSKGEPMSTVQNHSEPIAIADRSAQVTWKGSLAAGHGTIRSSSGALTGQEVTWVARTEQPEGKTSPEELCAAAHSACFSMALALKLGEHGTPPDELEVEATVALADVDGTPTITSSALEVTAVVADLDQPTFDKLVAQATELCPVSRLFAGAHVSIHAQLAET